MSGPAPCDGVAVLIDDDWTPFGELHCIRGHSMDLYASRFGAGELRRQCGRSLSRLAGRGGECKASSPTFTRTSRYSSSFVSSNDVARIVDDAFEAIHSIVMAVRQRPFSVR